MSVCCSCHLAAPTVVRRGPVVRRRVDRGGVVDGAGAAVTLAGVGDVGHVAVVAVNVVLDGLSGKAVR